MKASGNKDFNSSELEEAAAEAEDDETKATKRRAEMKRRQDELMSRGEKKEFLRRLLTERNEVEQEEKFLRAQEARELRSLQEQQTRKLGEELLRTKNEELREQNRRILLRKNSIELRQLEDQLRAAYAAKDAKIQLSQREIRKKNERIEKVEEMKIIQSWYQDDSFEKQQMLEARRKKEEYRRDLQNQLVLNHRLRQQKAEETRRGRKLVEETSEMLRAEDLENQRRKRETATRLLAEERAFVEAREYWKFKEKQAIQKEHENYTRILADKMIEIQQSDDLKVAAAAAKEAMMARMRKQILQTEAEKRERENTTVELIAEEQRLDLENLSRKAAQEKYLTAKGLMKDMLRQRSANEERKAREAEIDRAFSEYLERERRVSVIADKRKSEERRARDIEYGKALREGIANDRIRYTEGILLNQEALRRNRKLDEARRVSIDEERSRILVEHAPRLRGFLKPDMSGPEVAGSANKAANPRNY